jgi:hypothetical protein
MLCWIIRGGDSQDIGDTMQCIGRLAGKGKLKSDTVEFGTIDYRMEAWKQGEGWKYIEGTLGGNEQAILGAAFASDRSILELAGGEQVSIIITEDGSDGTRFLVALVTEELERLILAK